MAKASVKTEELNLLPSSLRAILAGAGGGVLAALMLLGLEAVQAWIWGPATNAGLATQRPLVWCLSVPMTIGLLLSLLQTQRLPSRLPEFSETLMALRQSPSAGGGRMVWQPALGGTLALIGAGSLGPEALVTHAVVAISRWIWRGQDRQVSAAALAGSLGFFGTPLAGPVALAGRHAELIWRWLPGTLAGISGFLCFHGLKGLGGGLSAVPYALPETNQTSPLALLAALVGGAVGSGCGLALLGWRRWLHCRMETRSVPLAPLFTGLILGISLWAFPLAPFSGELQLQPMLLGQWPLPAWLVLVSGALKLLLQGLCLETGWRGGQIFPVLTGGAAIGLGMHELLPGFADVSAWCGSVVGGCLGVVIPSPLLSLLLGLTLLRGHGAGGLLVGLVCSQVLRHRDPSRHLAGELEKQCDPQRQP